MKLIKLGLISVLVLFGIITLMSALLPSTVLVSRAINIQTPGDSVLAVIRDLPHWQLWMEGMDKPQVMITDSLNAGMGETSVKITGITDSTVTAIWTTRNSQPQIATIRLIAAPTQKMTIVQWQFVQKIRWYPWEKFGSMMNDKIIGTMMERNLQNLKVLLESR